MLTIVITMAGLGSRFRKVGYKVPKYMIEAKGKTLFEWSMTSLYGFRERTEKYIFIVRKEDNAVEFIQEKCRMMGLANIEVVELDELTDGQATTALLAKKSWREDSELLIYNIDTYVEENEMNSSQIQGDGFIPCFNASGDHWSFVKTDEIGRAIEIREKKRISDNCTLGAYYFRSCKLYEILYSEYYMDGKNEEKGEKYVAPLYNYLLEKGGEVMISHVECDKVHVLGTPEELDDFINSEQL